MLRVRTRLGIEVIIKDCFVWIFLGIHLLLLARLSGAAANAFPCSSCCNAIHYPSKRHGRVPIANNQALTVVIHAITESSNETQYPPQYSNHVPNQAENDTDLQHGPQDNRRLHTKYPTRASCNTVNGSQQNQ